jgi:N-acetylglucosamine malate deacetylase 1
MEHVVAVVAPHPDDAEIGMGGTIAALTQGGAEVVIIDLTDGEPTPHGSREIRAQETKAASHLLGVRDRVLLDVKNREIFDSVENRKLLASALRQYKPEIIFVPYWEDGHPDHVQACVLGEAARFYSKFVKTDMPFDPHYPRKLLHYFCTHIRPRAQPSFVFDISAFIEVKLKSVEAYRSQFVENEKNREVLGLIGQENAHWGFQVQAAYGEPFICREHICLKSVESLLNA